MKLKKFFAGVLAAAMMLTVGATAAFATAPAQNSNYDKLTSAESTWSVGKKYWVKNGISPAETFKFDIEFERKFDCEASVTSDPVVDTTAKFEIPFEAKVANLTTAYTGSFTVSPKQLGLGAPQGVGKYVYKITERASTTSAVVTNEGTAYLVVTVAHAENADGSLNASSYVYYAGLYRNADLTGTKVDNTNAFVNTYGEGEDGSTIHKLTMSKTVHGSMANLQKDFTFNVTFNADTDNGKTNADYAGAVVSAADKDKITKGTLGANNTLVMGTTYTVTLGHGDSIEFNNLPEGIHYTLSETDVNAQNQITVDGIAYNVTLTNNAKDADTEAKTLTSGSWTGAMAKANDVAAFHNTNPSSPDMGVVLDNAPYIAMLAIVAIGGVALMLNKRRRDEE